MITRILKVLAVLLVLVGIAASRIYSKPYGVGFVCVIAAAALILCASLLEGKIALVPPFYALLKFTRNEKPSLFVCAIVLHIMFILFLLYCFLLLL